MRVYLFTPQDNPTPYFENMRAVLDRAGIVVVYKRNEEVVGMPQDLLRETQDAGATFLDRVDGFVIDVTVMHSEIGYLMAYALLRNKPAICIFQRGTNTQPVFEHVQPRQLKHFMVKAYSQASLEKVLLLFVRKLEATQPGEDSIPNIKFTLRITRAIEQYLHWKTHNTTDSKADYLRELVGRFMEEDERYRRYLVQKRGGKEL